MHNNNQNTESLNYSLMLIIALVQGVFLYVLYYAVGHNYWMAEIPPLFVMLISVCIVAPILANLILNNENIKRTVKWLLLATAVVSGLGYFTGWQLNAWESEKIRTSGAIAFIFVCSMLILVFKYSMYVQQRVNQELFEYEIFYKYSWRNSLTFILASLFTTLFVGALFLAAALFRAIELNWLLNLLREAWFIIPTVTLLFTLGIIIFRQMPNTLDTIQNILSALFKWLLVLLSVFAIVFLIALLVQGLDLLWQTGRGTFLVLLLLALFLFALNAVYQNYIQQPYKGLSNKIVQAGIYVIPVYGLIGLYGLYLRIADYGLTVSRCWALYIAALLTLLSSAYVIAKIVNGVRVNKSMQAVEGKMNIAFGLFLLCSLVLIHSPVLDFKKISLASQLKRYHDAGEMKKSDMFYITKNLGKSGELALKGLMEKDEALQVQFSACQNNWWQCKRNEEVNSFAALEKNITYLPSKFDMPDDLKKRMLNQWEFKKHQALVFKQDIDGDGMFDFVTVTQYRVSVWHLSEHGNWKAVESYRPSLNFYEQVKENQRIITKPPRWPDIIIDGEQSPLR